MRSGAGAECDRTLGQDLRARLGDDVGVLDADPVPRLGHIAARLEADDIAGLQDAAAVAIDTGDQGDD
jgi:hypothetical protein